MARLDAQVWSYRITSLRLIEVIHAGPGKVTMAAPAKGFAG
ncbi:hypothetical protein SAMN04489716_2448 [Actinoplanes derwentensis]|uniref:Uncharacterized protein n=1 Tax=Actinoplanes derwentensis TaxID=113562 RepID=A0A1H1XFT5_9ACTN|nr:hypothetical protein SAMN04489716_2448 [Actinoplanes derwentensis]